MLRYSRYLSRSSKGIKYALHQRMLSVASNNDNTSSPLQKSQKSMRSFQNQHAPTDITRQASLDLLKTIRELSKGENWFEIQNIIDRQDFEILLQNAIESSKRNVEAIKRRMRHETHYSMERLVRREQGTVFGDIIDTLVRSRLKSSERLKLVLQKTLNDDDLAVCVGAKRLYLAYFTIGSTARRIELMKQSFRYPNTPPPDSLARFYSFDWEKEYHIHMCHWLLLCDDSNERRQLAYRNMANLIHLPFFKRRLHDFFRFQVHTIREYVDNLQTAQDTPSTESVKDNVSVRNNKSQHDKDDNSEGKRKLGLGTHISADPRSKLKLNNYHIVGDAAFAAFFVMRYVLREKASSTKLLEAFSANNILQPHHISVDAYSSELVKVLDDLVLTLDNKLDNYRKLQNLKVLNAFVDIAKGNSLSAIELREEFVVQFTARGRLDEYLWDFKEKLSKDGDILTSLSWLKIMLARIRITTNRTADSKIMNNSNSENSEHTSGKRYRTVHTITHPDSETNDQNLKNCDQESEVHDKLDPSNVSNEMPTHGTQFNSRLQTFKLNVTSDDDVAAVTRDDYVLDEHDSLLIPDLHHLLDGAAEDREYAKQLGLNIQHFKFDKSMYLQLLEGEARSPLSQSNLILYLLTRAEVDNVTLDTNFMLLAMNTAAKATDRLVAATKWYHMRGNNSEIENNDDDAFELISESKRTILRCTNTIESMWRNVINISKDRRSASPMTNVFIRPCSLLMDTHPCNMRRGTATSTGATGEPSESDAISAMPKNYASFYLPQQPCDGKVTPEFELLNEKEQLKEKKFHLLNTSLRFYGAAVINCFHLGDADACINMVQNMVVSGIKPSQYMIRFTLQALLLANKNEDIISFSHAVSQWEVQPSPKAFEITLQALLRTGNAKNFLEIFNNPIYANIKNEGFSFHFIRTLLKCLREDYAQIGPPSEHVRVEELAGVLAQLLAQELSLRPWTFERLTEFMMRQRIPRHLLNVVLNDLTHSALRIEDGEMYTNSSYNRNKTSWMAFAANCRRRIWKADVVKANLRAAKTGAAPGTPPTPSIAT